MDFFNTFNAMNLYRFLFWNECDGTFRGYTIADTSEDAARYRIAICNPSDHIIMKL